VKYFDLSLHDPLEVLRVKYPVVAVFLLFATFQDYAVTTKEPFRGLIVSSVKRNLEADSAGIRSGDILLSWQSHSARGQLESAFDLSIIEVEQAPKGRIHILGLRNGTKKTWVLGQDRWGIATRPAMQGPVLQLYNNAELLARSGKASEAATAWTEAAVQAGPLAPWISFHAAETFAGLRKWELADGFYQKAIQQASGARPAVISELLNAWSTSLQQRGQFRAAVIHYQESLEEARKESSTLRIADIFNRLGNATTNLGDLLKGEKYYLESLSLRRREAPGSIVVAAALSNLGLLESQRGDLVKAEAYHKEALRIARRLSPYGPATEAVFTNLGVVSFRRGDAQRTEDYYKQALEIQRRSNSHSLAVSLLLNNIGLAAFEQGKLKRAEACILRALAISMKLDPESLSVARSFNALADIAHRQGKAATSEEYLRKALAIENKAGDQGFARLITVNNLADILDEKGDLDEAEQYYREAIEITRKMGSAVADRFAPLAGLASILARKQQPEAATRLFEEALTSLEMEATQLGGTEIVRAGFRAQRASYYLDYIDLLIAQGKPEQAFLVLERSRSRTLLEMLAESHVNIRGSIAPELLERERSLHQKLDTSIQRQLQVLSSRHTDQQLAAINNEVEGFLRQYQQLQAEIRVRSPAYSTLIQPRILSTNEIQEQLLDDDTLLLEYSLGSKHSYVWAATQAAVECHELPKREEINSIARQFYRLLNAPNYKSKQRTTIKRRRELIADVDLAGAAATLSKMVLGPVSAQLNHKRVLVVSDGALQYVPFAALPMPNSESHSPLLAEHEVVALPSASVMASLRETGLRNRPAKTVVVLADPVFDRKDIRVHGRRGNISGKPSEPTSRSPGLERLFRSAADSGLIDSERLRLPRLVFSRKEAEAILAVVPGGEAMVALDFSANRTLATSQELAQYRIVHFATHGLLNSKHPELSGLVFSLVDKRGRAQNGFLQLEEIYNLKLPVELVVLSACETGLGKEIHKEGLLGLTRGFMYAGASRVVASLWKVDDVATAELMGRFYKAMEKEKLPAAAALRRAQLEMWQQSRWNHPYYWAAFQIQGEWK
jgi:CHAT domain-containing protein/tetratricopeptide (TPR) repeat protein